MQPLPPVDPRRGVCWLNVKWLIRTGPRVLFYKGALYDFLYYDLPQGGQRSDETWSLRYRDPDESESCTCYDLQPGESPECDEIRNVIEYSEAVQKEDIVALLGQTLQMQEVKRANSYPEPGQDSPPNFEELSPGYGFYRRGRDWYAPPHGYAYNLLLYNSFDAFRPLGFAFCDSERLQAYGFRKPQDVETSNQDGLSEQPFISVHGKSS